MTPEWSDASVPAARRPLGRRGSRTPRTGGRTLVRVRYTNEDRRVGPRM